MKIRKMDHSEPPPMNLLLLADPSIEFIKDYVNRGETYFAEINGEVVGVYILLATRPGTCEIINIGLVKNIRVRASAENFLSMQ